ncbi:MAG: recombinase family protein, partial [Eubacteriales bacterium]|nr:recombinase family protein [Eubacteriales bacterium]
MTKYAYIRVSSKDQNIDRQMLALRPYDILPKNIFCDYQSGKDFDRPEYKRMLRKMREGDLLVIKSIDRLGRNYNDILTQWQYITKQLKADILVLDMSLLDTREKEGSLMGTLIADMVLQILAYVAETEREMIRQRQREGIQAAKNKGKHLGRKPVRMPENFEYVCQMHMEGKISVRNAAALLGVNHSTFYRRCGEYRKKHVAALQ